VTRNRRGDEIDIAAIGEKPYRVLLGEVKWNSRPLGVKDIRKLLDKRTLVDWYNDKREEHFLIISKAGFTKSAEDFMNANGIEGRDLIELLDSLG
jgi:hypothetical protein